MVGQLEALAERQEGEGGGADSPAPPAEAG
jgi:hypothetical protein